MTIDNSIVIPVYRNAENIDALLERLQTLVTELPGTTEVVFVVDGSPDDSHELLVACSSRLPFAHQIIRHSRNFGSFAAIRTGMRAANGDVLGVMAADLQEPAELMINFVELLSSGDFDIAVGRRVGRSDPTMSSLSSRAFWGVYRRLVLRDIPSGGVDIFACTRAVAIELLQLREANTSLVGLLYWVGFRRVEVPYERQAREIGKSGWTFRRKSRYLIDSVFSFTDLPLNLLIAGGLGGAALTVVAAVVVLIAYATGAIMTPGYTPLMLVVLFSSFALIVALGIVGLYVWRAFENTKGRPGAIVMSRFASRSVEEHL